MQWLASASWLVKANFNPNQPRVPAGNPDGGQWTDAGGSKQTPELPQVSVAAADEVPPGSDAGPPLGEAPNIPSEPPITARERNSIVRRTAEWLRQAAALGAQRAPDTRVRTVLRVLEGTARIVEYLPEIWSYLDRPKTLSELQDAVRDRGAGY
ncbi:MAG: hypothetical protein AB7H90_11370 [Alphaproteobacteria bacterium]